MNDVKKDWELYENGIAYNQALSINGKGYYETIDANLAFADGEQWRNAPDTDLPKPVFNIIKRVKQFKIASLATNNISVKLEPVEYREDGSMDDTIVASEIASAEIENVLAEWEYQHKQRELLSDGFDTGDYAVHVLFNPDKVLYNGQYGEYKGEIELEIVDGQNVMFGNPNINDEEKQPYILLVGRDLVSNLTEEGKENITSDYSNEFMAGDAGKIEIKGDKSGKALYVIKYYKKNGIVHASKYTKDAYIFKDVNMGLKMYPIILGNYEKVKNCYHGRAETSGIIPNQIAINKLFAMVIYHTMLTSFPTLVYNKRKVGGWTNELGFPIGVDLTDGESIGNVAQYLQTGNIGAAVTSIIELLMAYTKEVLGVNDATLGNINPQNTSAIIAVQRTTAVPLENVKASFYSFTKKLVERILDRISSNYGIRPIVVEQMGQRNVVEYDFNKLKSLYFTTNIEIGASGYYSDIASTNTLDNLLTAGMINFIQYLERVDDSLIPNKQKLIDELKGQMKQQQEGQYEQMAQFIETLPPEQQAQLQGMDANQLETAVKTMMQQGGKQ